MVKNICYVHLSKIEMPWNGMEGRDKQYIIQRMFSYATCISQEMLKGGEREREREAQLLWEDVRVISDKGRMGCGTLGIDKEGNFLLAFEKGIGCEE